MTLLWLRLIGSLLVRVPLPLIKGLAIFTGEFIFLVARERRRFVLSNLSHAFPDRDYPWLVATGRESLRQMMEFALLAAALPYFSEKRLARILTISPESQKYFLEKTAARRPVVLIGPHLGPQETLCMIPFLVPGLAPISGIYRPLKNAAVDQWIRESRGRFGMQLFSRKRGLQTAIQSLKKDQWFGLLFDQNSSSTGSLITFFDRVASATDLPGIVAAKYDADVIMTYAKRHRFWHFEICVVPGPKATSKDDVLFATNLWLENLLRENDQLLPGWLWAHNRWRHQRLPQLSLRGKKNCLEKQNTFLGRDRVPRSERFFLRLPDHENEVAILLPLIRALRRSRPDAAITVIGKAPLLAVVQEKGLCEQAIALPPPGPGYWWFFWRLRRRFPQVYLVFANSRRHDLEAKLAGAPHRYGPTHSGGRARSFLTKTWIAPTAPDGTEEDLFQHWEQFLRAYGLEGPVEPFSSPRSKPRTS